MKRQRPEGPTYRWVAEPIDRAYSALDSIVPLTQGFALGWYGVAPLGLDSVYFAIGDAANAALINFASRKPPCSSRWFTVAMFAW
jgi:hypothetical protein